jgi:hypothetical protein
MTIRNKATKITMAQLRKAAGPHVEVYDDRDSGCYRATCMDGWAFEAGELHELIADYSCGERWYAKADLLDRLQSEPVEPCDAPTCDWCKRR